MTKEERDIKLAKLYSQVHTLEKERRADTTKDYQYLCGRYIRIDNTYYKVNSVIWATINSNNIANIKFDSFRIRYNERDDYYDILTNMRDECNENDIVFITKEDFDSVLNKVLSKASL